MRSSVLLRAATPSFGGVRKAGPLRRLQPRDYGFAALVGFCAVPVAALAYFNAPIRERIAPTIQNFYEHSGRWFEGGVAVVYKVALGNGKSDMPLTNAESVRLRLMSKAERDALLQSREPSAAPIEEIPASVRSAETALASAGPAATIALVSRGPISLTNPAAASRAMRSSSSSTASS